MGCCSSNPNPPKEEIIFEKIDIVQKTKPKSTKELLENAEKI